MQCTNPILLFNVPGRRADFPDGLTVPCGKCLHCRISKEGSGVLECYTNLNPGRLNIYHINL